LHRGALSKAPFFFRINQGTAIGTDFAFSFCRKPTKHVAKGGRKLVRIKVDTSKCTGCGICELACSAAREKVYNPEKARIRVVRLGLPAQSSVLVCAQCMKAACAAVCPANAITRNESTGVWTVDDSLCLGCGLCVDACPLDAIKLHPDSGTAIKCDLCAGLGEPACVSRCPKGALSVYEGKPHFSQAAGRLVEHYLEQQGLSKEQFLIPNDMVDRGA
jgi:Fe-S-cluster-containing hydrogenase component 2